MHYQDGTPVQIGDLARKVSNAEYAKTSTQNEILGTVVSGQPSATSCNLQIDVLAVREVGPLGASPWRRAGYDYPQCVNANEFLLVARNTIEAAAAA